MQRLHFGFSKLSECDGLHEPPVVEQNVVIPAKPDHDPAGESILRHGLDSHNFTPSPRRIVCPASGVCCTTVSFALEESTR